MAIGKAIKNKYRAKKITVDGYTFDSMVECKRYGELKLLVKAGKISELDVHPKYTLQYAFKQGNEEHKAITYTPDFRYIQDGKVYVEDVKSKVTAKRYDYKLKIKMFKYKYPEINFLEVLK